MKLLESRTMMQWATGSQALACASCPTCQNVGMNYFAHGIRFLDRPYFVAGTAVPDWLNVADRQVRMRVRRVRSFLESLSDEDSAGECSREIAEGVLQHLEDDRWFHGTEAFHKVSSRMGRLFRELLGPDDGFRPGFLGHIVMELLLDAVLIRKYPDRIDRYYDVLRSVDANIVQSTVNQMAQRSTDRLAGMISMFNEVQFLRDYLDDERLLNRLNQVMRRIKLQQLPDSAERVLNEGRKLVERSARRLLPSQHHFAW